MDAPRAYPFDVFESKLHVPALRTGTVARIGLVNRFRAERTRRLTTVVAGPGYGKTTLLAQWATRDDRACAWLAIDRRDNDPLVLLRHLAVALDRIERLDDPVLEALADRTSSVWDAAAPRLAAAISSRRRPFVLLLDGADLVHEGESADVLAAIAAEVPEGSMLVASGRSTPPLSVARLRAGGHVLEFDNEDLVLRRAEARRLLHEAGLTIGEDAFERLFARTEGWAVGLYLASVVLDPERTNAADTLDGDDRYVSEYFHAEQLSQLDPARLAFLRRTSLLERLSGPLCDAVLESADSARELERLQQANVFLVPLDRHGEWYRYHHLFRDALRSELHQHEPGVVRDLDRRAAAWLDPHGEPELALEHAQAAGETDWAADLLARIALPTYLAGRVATVDTWIARLATEAPLERYPQIAVLHGWLDAQRGRTASAARSVAAGEAALTGSRRARSDTLASTTALLRATMCADGVERMDEDVEAALVRLEPDSAWRPSALLLRAVVHLLGGEPQLADEAFAEAAAAAEAAGAADVLLLALAERSLAASARADHAEAARLALEARDRLEQGLLADYPITAIVRAAAAKVLLRESRWEDARRELAAADEVSGLLTDAVPWLAVQTRLALAVAYVTLRDRERASQELDECLKVLDSRPRLGTLSDDASELLAELTELPEPPGRHGAGLTNAELRLLPLLATHLSFREIGERLFVSRNTIKTQAISVYRKLGVCSRSAAIVRASELGLLSDPIEDRLPQLPAAG